MSVDTDGYLLSQLVELETGVLMEPPISPKWPALSNIMYQQIHQKPLLSGHAPADRVRPDA